MAKNKLSNIENILNNQTESFRKLLSNIRKYRETNDSEECHFLQNEIRLSHATAINAKSDKISFASPLLEIIKVDFNLNSENIKITTSNNIVDSKIAYAEEEKQKIEKERKKAEQELYEAKKILEEQKLQNEKNEKNRSYIDDINTQIAQIKAETERLKIHNDNMISEQKKFEEKLELAQKEKYEQEQANLRAQHPLKMGFRGIPWETTGDKLEKQYGLKVSYESVNNGVTDVKTKDGDIEVTDGKIVISDGYNEEIIYGDTDFLTKQTKTVEYKNPNENYSLGDNIKLLDVVYVTEDDKFVKVYMYINSKISNNCKESLLEFFKGFTPKVTWGYDLVFQIDENTSVGYHNNRSIEITHLPVELQKKRDAYKEKQLQKASMSGGTF